MAAKPTPDAVLQAIVDEVTRHGGNASAACRAMGGVWPTFQSRLKQAAQRGMVPSKGVVSPDDPLVLKAQIKRMEAELKQHSKQDEQVSIIKGVIGSMVRQVEELDPPAWVITPPAKKSTPGVPTLFVSDLHWGETVYAAQVNNVNEYSIKIAHKRMAVLIDSAVHLLKIISPTMDYPGIVLPLGGDLISGNIHDELTATNELNSMPTVLDIYGVLVGVIESLAKTFGKVFVPCVAGNHGRNTPKIWNKDRHATSFDWLICKFLAKHFDLDKRVTFFVPDGISAHYNIYDYRYRLAHGDRLGRGGDGIIGMLGPVIRGDHRTRSRDSQINLGYDTQIIGHFHSYTHTQRVIVNGSLKGYDEFANNEGFPFERPQQALWLTNATHGITFRMPVFVDPVVGKPKVDWLSFAGGK